MAADSAEVWLRCELRNDEPAADRWLLCGSLYHTQKFEVYLTDAAGRLRFRQRAASGPGFRAAHAVAGRHYNLVLPLPAGQPRTLYIQTSGGVLRFSLLARERLHEKLRREEVAAGLYFGVLLALLLYNLLLYFSVRDRSYLYYVLFVASFGLLQADMTGYLYQLLDSETGTTGLPVYLQNVLISLTAMFSILTARAFLETARLVPRLDRALWLTLLFAPVLGLSSAVPALQPLTAGLSYVVPLLTVAVLLAAGLAVLHWGFRPARYYLAGWTVLMAAIVLYYLRTLGVVPVSFLTEHGVRMASALEVILISLGLADRINLARRDRALAQAEALALAREKVDVQRQTNEQLRQSYDELQASLATNEELHTLDELKTRFFTNISHELRTPLTLILSPLEQLLTEPTPRPELRPMHRNAQRLLHLISQLLDIARLEAGQLRLLAVPTDLGRAARTTVAAFAALALARDLTLDLEVAGPLPGAEPLFADPEQLEQILYNLLSNALKFTPAGGQVRVAVAYDARYATVAVRDTGVGIAAAELPGVFERFRQAGAGRRRQYGGSGVGLALVRELAALHGGAATASSTVGEGSTFAVRLALGTAHLAGHDLGPALPAAQATEAAARTGTAAQTEAAIHAEAAQTEAAQTEAARTTEAGESGAAADAADAGEIVVSGTGLAPWQAIAAAELTPEPEELEPAALGGMNGEGAGAGTADARPLVLIVDDSADLRHYLRQCLEADYRLLLAADGDQGLARALAAVPDLILTDLMMPGLDGRELCRRLKTDERTSHVPVVLLTALTNDISRLGGYEDGADDYLTKPFRPAELRARVRNLIVGRQQLRQRFGREVTLQPHDISLTSLDERFLSRALAVVETNLANSEFSSETFATEMALSRMQLHRKLKALTDQSATAFVRTLRLRRAAQLLAAGAANVAEAAEATGFINLSHFARGFRELHGQLPSTFAAGREK